MPQDHRLCEFICQSARKMLVYYMDALEQKLKRKVQIIVACAMSLFFVLITALTFTFAIRLNQEAQIRHLEELGAQLRELEFDYSNDISYFKSLEFAESLALRYFDSGKDGSQKLK